MITQAIKGWLQKLFAWWPWKQSTPVEHRQVASTMSRGFSPETPSWSQREGTISQSGVAPRLSTLENPSERVVQSQPETSDLSPLSVSASPGNRGAESAGERVPVVPTTQQRLEFLRYLVRRGIVNEGFERKE